MSDLFHGTGQAETAEPKSRAAQRNNPLQRRRRRQRRIRSILIVLITAALVVGAGYVVKDSVGSLFSSDDQEETLTDFPGPGTGEVEVEVKQGSSGAAIGQTLVDEGVVATQGAFTDAIKSYTQTYGADPNLQFGTYRLSLEMPAADALLAMLDSGNRIQSGVTIREGMLTSETFEKIASVTSISMDDLEKAKENPEDLGLPKSADGNLDGWLAPAKYPFTDDTTATELLSTMIAKQVSDLDALDVAEEDRQTVLTKASLVEAEAPAEGRAKVARVIENRLDIDMRLEFDSTIHFLEGRNPDVTTTEEQRQIDSPYNTYQNTGLPPGPIANPGKMAIEAALNPEPGDWLFFVTVDGNTGETKFADTYKEHLVNVEEFRQWLRDNPTADEDDVEVPPDEGDEQAVPEEDGE